MKASSTKARKTIIISMRVPCGHSKTNYFHMKTASITSENNTAAPRFKFNQKTRSTEDSFLSGYNLISL
jgi:hypothetical protein